MLNTVTKGKAARSTALLLSASMVVPPLLVGCGGGAPEQTASAPPPPGMARPNPAMRPAPKQGMSTGKKVALLAGAAALYYIYKKRQAKAETARGPEGKYFRSESTGRIYYRDLKTGKFQWVSPPSRPIQVPVEEAREYQGYAGYDNNMNAGQAFGGYGPGQKTYTDAEPAMWN